MFDIIFPLQRRFIRFRPPLLHPCMRCDGRASIEESLLLVAYSETQEEEEDHKQKEEEAGRRRSRLSGSDDPQSWRKAIQLYRYKSSKAPGILCHRIIREPKRDDLTNNNSNHRRRRRHISLIENKRAQQRQIVYRNGARQKIRFHPVDSLSPPTPPSSSIHPLT